jgi:hypothetical protein
MASDRVDAAIRAAAAADQQAAAPITMNFNLAGGRHGQLTLPSDTTDGELLTILGLINVEGRRMLVEQRGIPITRHQLLVPQ